MVVHPAAPPLRADMSLRQEFTQAEVCDTVYMALMSAAAGQCFGASWCASVLQVVTRVIDSMVRVTSRGGTNVLCYGFRKVRCLSRRVAAPRRSGHVD